MNKFTIFLTAFITNIYAFYIGVGGITACYENNITSYYKNCKNPLPLYKTFSSAKNINAFSVWITRDWKEQWYPSDMINDFIKHGYTPIFIFYYFADDISPKYVKTHTKEYFKHLKKFREYLNKINGKKIVIINPEYNENGMHNSKDFDILQTESIMQLKDENTSVGICLGDFGNYNKIWDSENWDLYENSMKFSSKVSDFIAFQEMRALTRNTKQEILNTPLRALAFATYLHKKYNKPTFLAYLAVSSYKDEKLQSDVFKEFAKIMPLFKHSANLKGFNLFNYIDVPTHKGYFKEAEKYFGIIKADGEKKPAFKNFLNIK